MGVAIIAIIGDLRKLLFDGRNSADRASNRGDQRAP
jgi:hypothetical protein